MSIKLTGRVPRVTTAMSPRMIWFAVLLAVSGVLAVIYGFHYRIARKESAKAAVSSPVAASDAATSNRAAVHGGEDVPGATPAANLAGSPVSAVPSVQPSPSSVQTGVSVLGGAVRTVAQPFGGQSGGQSGTQQESTLPSSSAAPAYAMPAPAVQPPPVDSVARMKAEREERAYERRLAAIEAPTSESQTATGPTDPSSQPKGVDQLVQADLARLRALTGTPNSSSFAPPQTAMPGVVSTEAPVLPHTEDEDDPNGQGSKRAFQHTSEGDYLKTTRMAPISPWVVERGEVIPAGLPSQIVSDLPGDLVAEVKRDIYDTPQHRYVMIPAGSLLAGEYNSAVTYGQKRVQVVWTYLRFPDGSFVDLDKFVGHSAEGGTGLTDQVDNHLKRLVGGIAMSSLFAAGIQISQNHTNAGGSTLAYPSNTQIAASAAGQQAAQLGQEITARNLQVQPTIKIRPGDIFSVSVMKSIIFPGPYRPLPHFGASQ